MMSQTNCFENEGKRLAGSALSHCALFFTKSSYHAKQTVRLEIKCFKKCIESLKEVSGLLVAFPEHQKRGTLTTTHNDCPPVHCRRSNLLEEVNPFSPDRKVASQLN